jgi:thioredoxin 1
MLGPRLEVLIAGKKGKVVLAKIDIDQMTDLAVSHGVEAVPTVLAMKDGKVLDRFVGLKDEADLETFVQKLIN